MKSGFISFAGPAYKLLVGGAFLWCSLGSASAQDAVKIGFPLFLSGPGAASVGEPSRNAAELVVEALNAGTLPAPITKSA